MWMWRGACVRVPRARHTRHKYLDIEVYAREYIYIMRGACPWVPFVVGDKTHRSMMMSYCAVVVCDDVVCVDTSARTGMRASSWFPAKNISPTHAPLRVCFVSRCVLRRRRMSAEDVGGGVVRHRSIVVLQGCVVDEEDAEGVEGVGGAGERARAGDGELDARAVGGGGGGDGVSGGGGGVSDGGVGRCS